MSISKVITAKEAQIQTLKDSANYLYKKIGSLKDEKNKVVKIPYICFHPDYPISPELAELGKNHKLNEVRIQMKVLEDTQVKLMREFNAMKESYLHSQDVIFDHDARSLEDTEDGNNYDQFLSTTHKASGKEAREFNLYLKDFKEERALYKLEADRLRLLELDLIELEEKLNLVYQDRSVAISARQEEINRIDREIRELFKHKASNKLELATACQELEELLEAEKIELASQEKGLFGSSIINIINDEKRNEKVGNGLKTVSPKSDLHVVGYDND